MCLKFEGGYFEAEHRLPSIKPDSYGVVGRLPPYHLYWVPMLAFEVFTLIIQPQHGFYVKCFSY